MSVIENILTEYKELFTIEFRHPAFEREYSYVDPVTHATKTLIISSIFEKLLLEPDQATKDLFINHAFNFHYKNFELTCYVRVSNNKLFIDLTAASNLRFLLFANSEFLRRTDITAAGS